MKKSRLFMLPLAAAMMIYTAVPVTAEPDYSDTEYWTEKCTGTGISDYEDYEACEAYREYVADQSEHLSERLAEVDAEREQIAANIKEYGGKIEEYQKEADKLNGDISALDRQIGEIEVRIDEVKADIEVKEAEIAEKQKGADKIAEKIRQRMQAAQSTMRINSWIDLILGVRSFDEFLRLMSGITNINRFDTEANEELAALMDELNRTKEELEADEKEVEDAAALLEQQRTAVLAKQNELEVMKYRAQVIREEYKKTAAKLEAESAQIAVNIDEIQATMNGLAGELDNIPDTVKEVPVATPEPTPVPTPEPTPVPEEPEDPEDGEEPGEPEPTPEPTPEPDPEPTPEPDEPVETIKTGGWVYPVPGAYRSAGTWYYEDDGGVHLGYDFAAPVGTSILAEGNGVVLRGTDACPTYGGLGDGCGYPGSYGGGNQVYLLIKMDGSLYAVKHCHLMSGTAAATGTIVSAGDVIGRVGSSGNSDGPHCHIEIFYLGSAENFTYYATHWNVDYSFGCGWYEEALGRLCENGVGAPCRVRPESIFGY